MSKTFSRVLAGMVALTLVAAACSSDKQDAAATRPVARPPRRAEDRLQGHRPVGRRPVRHGEAAVEDRADDRLRVAGALAEGPGDRARGVGEGVQRARRRQRLVHRGHHLRRRRPGRPGRGVRADDRRGRRGRDRQRPGHGRPGRRVGGDGRRRRSRGSRRTSTQDDWADPNAYPMDASGTGVTFLHAAGAHRRRTPRRSASSGSTSPPRPR